MCRSTWRPYPHLTLGQDLKIWWHFFFEGQSPYPTQSAWAQIKSGAKSSLKHSYLHIIIPIYSYWHGVLRIILKDLTPKYGITTIDKSAVEILTSVGFKSTSLLFILYFIHPLKELNTSIESKSVLKWNQIRQEGQLFWG